MTNRVRQNESFPLPVLAIAVDVARQRNSQSLVKGLEQRQERSPEGPVLIGNLLSEPRGGSMVELDEEWRNTSCLILNGILHS